MKTVLPALTGHVPKLFKKFFTKAKLKSTSGWNLFDGTYILDAEDPLFAEIGKIFDQTVFDCQISQWEWSWVNDHKDFPVKPMVNLGSKKNIRKIEGGYKTFMLRMTGILINILIFFGEVSKKY